jgi:hypothetical protein
MAEWHHFCVVYLIPFISGQQSPLHNFHLHTCVAKVLPTTQLGTLRLLAAYLGTRMSSELDT